MYNFLELQFIKIETLNMVAQACNPSFMGGGDWEDHGSRPSQEKKFMRPPSSKPMAGQVVRTCHPSYAGMPGQPRHRARPISKVTNAKRAGGVTQIAPS
jgi:hypothetical protein